MLSSVLALVSIFQAVTVACGQAITTLSPTQVNSFQPYSFYSAAAYCDPSTTLSWSCGVLCAGNPTFEPYEAGGDGNAVQFWYVGWDPTLGSVVVAHQGTNPLEILSLLTDGNIILTHLDSMLFPGIPSSIQVHEGFADEHAKTAPTILAAVLTLLNQYGTSSVVLTGHSLGAALALLESVYLQLHLPAGTNITMVGYGMPRVGNTAFANYVDALNSNNTVAVTVTHINHKKDPIPVVPGKFLGYEHPAGEIHIQDDSGTTWEMCPGHDNPSPLCSTGDVPVVDPINILDHLGPYDYGIIMGLC